MQPLFRMVIDRRRKVLQVAPGAAIGSPCGIFPAERPGDFVKPSMAEESQQTLRALTGFPRSRLSRRNIGKVDRDHVRYLDFR